MPATESEISWSIARLTSSPAGKSITAVREIDQLEYGRLGNAIADVTRAATLDVFQIVCQNMQAIDALHATLVRRARVDESGSERSEYFVYTAEFKATILSALSNYLSSGRMYTDSASDILSTSHGKDSAAYSGFKCDLASVFDDNAGYRFTYHLRNALQHVGSLPLEIVESVSDTPDERVRFVVDRERILAAYEWHRRVRSDLESGPAIVELLPLLRDGYNGYLWLERRRVRRCLEEAREQVLWLRQVVRDLAQMGSSLLLMALHKMPATDTCRQLTMAQRLFPNPQFLEAVAQGYNTGNFDPVLPLGYERPEPGSRRVVIDGLLLGPALDLLDAQYSAGHDAARQEIAQAIARGPQASATLISSLLNMSMITLSQVEMAIGQSIQSQLCSWRAGQMHRDGRVGDN